MHATSLAASAQGGRRERDVLEPREAQSRETFQLHAALEQQMALRDCDLDSRAAIPRPDGEARVAAASVDLQMSARQRECVADGQKA